MTEAQRPEWLIKKRGYFYRADKAGYTARLEDAGLYTEADAKAEAGIEPWVMSAHHISEFPTLRAALAPPTTPSPPAWLMDLDEAAAVPVDTGADEIGAIRGRHEVAEKDSGWEWAGLYADEAHADRATLLDRDARHVAEIARLTAELAAERERRVEVEGALKEIAQTSGTGCNPEGFAKIARAALKGDV